MVGKPTSQAGSDRGGDLDGGACSPHLPGARLGYDLTRLDAAGVAWSRQTSWTCGDRTFALGRATAAAHLPMPWRRKTAHSLTAVHGSTRFTTLQSVPEELLQECGAGAGAPRRRWRSGCALVCVCVREIPKTLPISSSEDEASHARLSHGDLVGELANAGTHKMACLNTTSCGA